MKTVLNAKKEGEPNCSHGTLLLFWIRGEWPSVVKIWESVLILEKEGFNSGERAKYRIYHIYPADPSQQVQTSWLIQLVQLMFI